METVLVYLIFTSPPFLMPATLPTSTFSYKTKSVQNLVLPLVLHPLLSNLRFYVNIISIQIIPKIKDV